MTLLEKLSEIEIKPDTRISDADRRYCTAQQDAYDNARTEFLSMHKSWKAFVARQKEILGTVSSESYEKEKYLRIDGVSSVEFQSKIEALPEIFISAIVSYFNHRYHVTVSSLEVKEALLPEKPQYSWGKDRTAEYHKTMRELSLRYEDILEQIFIQLGGRTFTERAIDELKKKCHDAAWNIYSSTPEYEIKSDTIRFTSYACSYSDWCGRSKWGLADDMKDVLRGAAHFETGQLDSYPAGVSTLLGWDDSDSSLFEFSGEKLKSLRMFKNHRVDLKFTGKPYANQFAAEYLGLVA